MQATARVALRCGPAARACALPAPRRAGWAQHVAVGSTRSSSFIKQVMEQVKRDMEADEKGKKDWEKATATTSKLKDKAEVSGEKMNEFGEKMRSMSEKTSEALKGFKETMKESSEQVRSRVNEKTGYEDSEAMAKAREAAAASKENLSAGSKVVFDRTKSVFDNVVDNTSRAFSFLDMDNKADRNAKLKQWKASNDIVTEVNRKKAEEEAAEKAAAEGVDAAKASDWKPADGDAQDKAKAEDPAGAVVVSDVGNSSWDRFGAGLRDMPFLNNVFGNPFFERMLGESEIAASIREMKEMDYTFNLEEFAEDIEYVVAPHIIRTYLEGESEALERHCGEACFAAVNSSIKARISQKLTLDTSILSGPKEIELKGAQRMDKGAPLFVWTFQMQQVNCLRDKDGEIIEGAVDDIRTVCYAMVVQRHPQVAEVELEYPWQISELAILWNQQCF